MALTKNAPNRANALKLMEFLSGNRAQRMYADQNYEIPVKVGVSKPPLVMSWGEFKVDALPLAEIAELRGEAIKLADEVGFDD
jgi:iron(III) transport system substrate-binding protein